MAVTSITAKPTRRFKNKHGLFTYRTVQPKGFCGYYIEKQNGFDILIAEPEKALIDYLYYKTPRNHRVSIATERFDKLLLAKLNRKRLNRYAALFNLNLKGLYADV